MAVYFDLKYWIYDFSRYLWLVASTLEWNIQKALSSFNLQPVPSNITMETLGPQRFDATGAKQIGEAPAPPRACLEPPNSAWMKW